MVLHLGRHEGSYHAWWQEIHVEIYGWSPQKRTAHLKREGIDTKVDLSTTGVAFTISDDGKGEVVELQ
jgi:hypothetical protein